MADIFSDFGRRQKEQSKGLGLIYGSKEYVQKERLGEKRVAEREILKETKQAYKVEKRKEDIQKLKSGYEKGKRIISGIGGFDINTKKVFSGGQEVKVKAIKRFASSGKSELHAKGTFEDVKKRFGRFD